MGELNDKEWIIYMICEKALKWKSAYAIGKNLSIQKHSAKRYLKKLVAVYL